MPCPYLVPRVPFGREKEVRISLETLVRDLRRYADGHLPSAYDLDAAPLITGWHPVADLSATRLAGAISGHPTVRTGPGVTSQIYAVDKKLRWARTASRLWRLGEPDEGEHD